VGYVETHGTGTELGDPIEVQALAAALGVDRPADRPVMLGSVKTNIGHLESAAGIAGFIKTVLVLQHGAIPPHLHLVEPNPHIAWADLPVTVPTRLTPWRSDGPRVAGVSSFGFSGTNVHVVLEQAPETPPQSTEAPDRAQVLTLGAKDPAALRALAGRWATHLAVRPDVELADLCFTANVGRGPFEHRAAYVVQSLSEAQRNLTALSTTDATAAAIVTGRASVTPRVAFLFPGQGAQYAGMGQQLFASEPVFRAALEECEAALETPGPALQTVLRGRAGALDRTADAQPAMFAIEYALATLWRAWGVEPAYVIGHSVVRGGLRRRGARLADRHPAGLRAGPSDARAGGRRRDGGRIRAARARDGGGADAARERQRRGREQPREHRDRGCAGGRPRRAERSRR
jgi:acyl transferase domain-containing protein